MYKFKEKDMKIPAVMWSVVLFRYVGKDEDKSSEQVYTITQKANLPQFAYLANDYPYSDTVWDVANTLKDINLETNNELKEIFFQYWKEVEYENKLRVFKNVDYQEFENHGKGKFEKELKVYYIENMINYPSIAELFRFRKDMSQDKLKEGLINVCKQTKFHHIKNQPNNKVDYWDNHIKGQEADKLLDLLELSGMKKEELAIFEKIGFFNEYRQAKFNKINKNEASIPLIETEDKNVYLLEVKINTIMLLNQDDKLGTQFLNSALKYMSILIQEALELQNVNSEAYTPLKLIAYNKESYDSAVTKREAVIKWMENNTILLLDKIKEAHTNNKNVIELKEETKELVKKIILKDKLENNLVKKNVKSKNKI